MLFNKLALTSLSLPMFTWFYLSFLFSLFECWLVYFTLHLICHLWSFSVSSWLIVFRSLSFPLCVHIYFTLPLSLSLQHTDLLFQRSHSSYLLLLDVGRQLFSVSDEETQTRLQTDLATLQEDWERSQCMLGKRRTLTVGVIKVGKTNSTWAEKPSRPRSCRR